MIPMSDTASVDPLAPQDDLPTLCAISILAVVLSTMLHEGIGHAAIAIATLHASGTLTSLAWSSPQDSRLVLAGGTLVNLAAGIVFWFLLRITQPRPALRLFLLLSMAFNLLTGAGYFFFSGVSNFGDWADFIQGLHPAWLWHLGLIVVGILAYYASILLIGTSLIRRMGAPLSDASRFRRLTLIPYFTAIVTATLAGLLNPLGMKYVLLSAVASTAGGLSGLCWMRPYIPKKITPGPAQFVPRSYSWIALSLVFGLIFIFVFGPGVRLPR